MGLVCFLFLLGVSGWLGGSGVLFCLVGLVGLVCLVSFLLFLFNGKGSHVGVFFFSHFFEVFFMDFWSLEVTFGEILVPLGRLWTCLVPGGSREPTLSK